MRRDSGVTLIELMITVAIIGVLSVLAAPGFVQFVRGQRVVSQVNDVVAALNLARNEAIKRGVPVAVCASANPNAASPGCSGATNWEEGWLVFTDNGGTEGDIDGSETLIRVGTGTPESTLNPDDGSSAYVRFASDGTADDRSDFTLSPDGASTGGVEDRTIELTATGRAQVAERFD